MDVSDTWVDSAQFQILLVIVLDFKCAFSFVISHQRSFELQVIVAVVVVEVYLYSCLPMWRTAVWMSHWT